MPQAILFDLDYTLTNHPASLSAFARHFLDRFGPDMHNAHLEELEATIHAADNLGEKPLTERWEFLQDELPWRKIPTAKILRDFWFEGLGQCAQPAHRMYITLNILREQRIKIGIIANGPAMLNNNTIDALAVRHFMDVVILSDMAQIKKPDPHIFAMALTELKVRSDKAWYVGTHPFNDVCGAIEAGMSGVWLRGLYAWPENLPTPEFTIDQLDQLLSLL